MATGRLFAYGTLRDPDVLAAVLGHRPAVAGLGRLHGHVALTVAGESYPILVPRPGAATTGTILAGLTAADWQALDRYEGAGYRRLPILVSTGAGMVSADAYIPARGLTAGTTVWDLADWTRRHKPAYLRRLRA